MVDSQLAGMPGCFYQPSTINLLQDANFAANLDAVHARDSAGEQALARIRVARNDSVQLVLRRAEMVADDFAQDGAEIARAPQISRCHRVHRGSAFGESGGEHGA